MTVAETRPAAGVGQAAFRVEDAAIDAGVLAVRRDGERHVNSAAGTAEFDLAGVSQASSVVLSLMLCWQRSAVSQGRDAHFSGVSDGLLDLARLNRVADILALV